MTSGDQRTIGLDRPVRLEWLDAAAGRLAAGDTPKVARDYVWNLLDGVVAGSTPQTARGKTLTVLGRVWFTPPTAAVGLRDAAAKVVAQASADERFAIHWAMLCAAYPFFVDVAGLVGKSLALNGEVALSQLTRRLVVTWGDRSTLRPATQRLVRSMVQWGALRDGGRIGLYLAPAKRIVVSSAIGELLVEGLLIAAQRGMPLTQLVGHPAAFPFDVRTDLPALRRSVRLCVHRQGDQTDFVELQVPPTQLPPLVAPRKSKESPSSAGVKSRRTSKAQPKSNAVQDTAPAPAGKSPQKPEEGGEASPLPKGRANPNPNPKLRPKPDGGDAASSVKASPKSAARSRQLRLLP